MIIISFLCFLTLHICLLQVHSVQVACGFLVACNCAMVVKSGDDIIKIDRCPTEGGLNANIPTQVFVYTNGELTQGTYIYNEENSNNYKVPICILLSCLPICIIIIHWFVVISNCWEFIAISFGCLDCATKWNICRGKGCRPVHEHLYQDIIQ